MNPVAKILLLITASILLATTLTIGVPDRSEAFSKQIVKVGASGKDVREMQGRLKLLGFYTGKVDGVFSWRSYWALRNFQYEFGLKVDGVLGPKTKLKLYNATKHYRPTAEELGVTPAKPATPGKKAPQRTMHTAGFSENDIRLMANAVYGEARGEPYVGQVAVAAVILNRTRHPSFPKTPAAVIFEPRAFTAVADGQIWLTPNATARKAVQDAINGWDPTGGCIYYFNPATATSAWIWSRPQVKRIGKHIFCR
jgi:N-acetylmuramoyl-L-alanine amidase